MAVPWLQQLEYVTQDTLMQETEKKAKKKKKSSEQVQSSFFFDRQGTVTFAWLVRVWASTDTTVLPTFFQSSFRAAIHWWIDGICSDTVMGWNWQRWVKEPVDQGPNKRAE